MQATTGRCEYFYIGEASDDVGQEFVHEPEEHIVEQVVHVPKNTPHKCDLQRTVERIGDVRVPRTVEDVIHEPVVHQELTVHGPVEHVPVEQIAEQVIQVSKTTPQRGASHRTVELFVDMLVPVAVEGGCAGCNCPSGAGDA